MQTHSCGASTMLARDSATSPPSPSASALASTTGRHQAGTDRLFRRLDQCGCPHEVCRLMYGASDVSHAVAVC